MRNIQPLRICLILLSALTVFITQCKKTETVKNGTGPVAFQDVLEKAEPIFSQYASSNEFRSVIGIDSVLQWYPDWNAISKDHRNSDTAVYFIPLNPKVIIKGKENNMVFIHLANTARYLIIHVYGRTMFDVYNATYISTDTSYKDGTGGDFFSSFTGTLLMNLLGDNQVIRYEYKNGQPVKRNSVNGGRDARWELQCRNILKCDWSAWCSYTGGLIITTTIGGITCVEPEPVSQAACYMSDPPAWELTQTRVEQDCEQVWIDDAPGTPGGGSSGGGGGRPTPTRQPLVDDSISDNLENPCYSLVLSNLREKGLANKISTMLNTLFGKTDKINVSFFTATSTNISFTELGHADAHKDKVTGVIYASIHLNDNLLHNAPQELIAEVLLHEILHAYMDAEYLDWKANNPNPTPPDPSRPAPSPPFPYDELAQHEIMAQSYIDDMRRALIELFPTLSARDANAMILSGLQVVENGNTVDFSQLLKDYELTKDQITDTMDKYLHGNGGTKCP